MKDNIFRAAIEEARRQIAKDKIPVGYYSTYLAIPFPSLALRYLLRYEGFPLGCLTMIVGKKASFKSMLSVEFAKMHIAYHGCAVIFDTEGGATTIADNVDGLFFESCSSLEDWQTKLTRYTNNLKEQVDKGTVAPVCLVIDSLIGAESRTLGEKVNYEGFAASTFPQEARRIAAFLRHKNSFLLRYPFSLVAISHLRESLNPITGATEEYIPGGTSLGFHAQIILKVTKLHRTEARSDGANADVKIMVDKNRLGPEGLHIEVPVRIRQVDTDTPQEATFLWHASTIYLLAEGHGFPIKIKEQMLNKVRKILRIERVQGGRKGILYYCEELGVRKEQAMPAEELGAILEQRQDILKELYKCLLVKKAPFLKVGEPYEPQILRLEPGTKGELLRKESTKVDNEDSEEMGEDGPSEDTLA